jgi:fluoroquinolone resistance protein
MNALTADADLSGASFERLAQSGANLAGCSLYQCTFERCAFTECDFERSIIQECVFRHCDLSLAKLRGASFTQTRFENCKLLGLNWTDTTWSRKGLQQRAVFHACTLDYATFTGLPLGKLQLTGCSARDADFSEADLSNADCSDTDFTGARFIRTNLASANFAGARNYVIDPRQVNLKDARFSMPEAVALLEALGIVLVDPPPAR